jgi:hypothetical protein
MQQTVGSVLRRQDFSSNAAFVKKGYGVALLNDKP